MNSRWFAAIIAVALAPQVHGQPFGQPEATRYQNGAVAADHVLASRAGVDGYVEFAGADRDEIIGVSQQLVFEGFDMGETPWLDLTKGFDCLFTILTVFRMIHDEYITLTVCVDEQTQAVGMQAVGCADQGRCRNWHLCIEIDSSNSALRYVFTVHAPNTVKQGQVSKAAFPVHLEVLGAPIERHDFALAGEVWFDFAIGLTVNEYCGRSDEQHDNDYQAQHDFLDDAPHALSSCNWQPCFGGTEGSGSAANLLVRWYAYSNALGCGAAPGQKTH